MLFSECEASAAVMKRITDGKRPSRPPKGKELGLSDLLWEIVQSSLASEVAERPPVSTFVDFFEKASPSISTFEELAQFDAHSEDDIKKFRCMFEYGDNTLLGMRENETLVVIEVFDRVSLLIRSPYPNDSDFVWSQILDSSLDDRTLRNQCLYGLQKVAVRCGLLPKSYWVSHSSLAEPSGTPSAIARVSNTCQWLINGELMAVKTISLEPIKNFKALKHVRLPLSRISLTDTIFRSFSRDYTPTRSCGSNYDIQISSVSLDLAPTLLSPLYTLGCPMGVCPTTCASTPMSIGSIWYVVALGQLSTF